MEQYGMHTVNDVQLYINKPGEETAALKPHPTAALPSPTQPVLLSFPPSSPSIKGTHGGTCQLTFAAEHVEVSELMNIDSCHLEGKTSESQETFDAPELYFFFSFFCL